MQPSRHEGYCLTLAEAKRFNKPIVTTDFVGALEQINNNETGLIVKFDECEIEKSVLKLIKDEKLRERLCSNLEKINYKNDTLEGLYALIN